MSEAASGWWHTFRLRQSKARKNSCPKPCLAPLVANYRNIFDLATA